MAQEEVTETPRPITMEDVQKTIGGMFLEIEMLRRENTALKAKLNGDKI